MKKTAAVLAIIFFSVGLVALGVFLVGTHFQKKSHDYEERREVAREHSFSELREKKVGKAKEAHADDYEAKKLQGSLKKKKYEKDAPEKDLKKVVSESQFNLKTWHFSEEDEDLEQAQAYVAYYKEQAESFQKLADEAKAEQEKLDKSLDDFARQVDELNDEAAKLKERGEKLIEETKQAQALFEKAKAELLGTPKFRRAGVEKKVRSAQNELLKKKVLLEKHLPKIKENNARFSRVSVQIKIGREKRSTVAKEHREYLEETLRCRSAQNITLRIVKNTEEIRALKAEIAELEFSSGDKKIEVYL